MSCGVVQFHLRKSFSKKLYSPCYTRAIFLCFSSENTSQESSNKKQPEFISFLGLKLASLSVNYGQPTIIKTSDGSPLYQFNEFKDVTFSLDDTSSIDKIHIFSKEQNINNARVGQTPQEIKNIIGNPISEEKPYELGEWTMIYHVDNLGNPVNIFFMSKTKDTPVKNLVVSYQLDGFYANKKATDCHTTFDILNPGEIKSKKIVSTDIQ